MQIIHPATDLTSKTPLFTKLQYLLAPVNILLG